jgi:hypothetical protein
MVIQLTVAENSSKSANASHNKRDIEKMVLFYAFLVLSKLVWSYYDDKDRESSPIYATDSLLRYQIQRHF